MSKRLGAVSAIVLTLIAWPLGVPLLWRSSAWTRSQKILGTAVVPGGLWTGYLLDAGDRSSCPITPAGSTAGLCEIGPTFHWLHPAGDAFNHVFGALVFVATVALPLVVAGYLAMRLRQRWPVLR